VFGKGEVKVAYKPGRPGHRNSPAIYWKLLEVSIGIHMRGPAL
jgi:hypothetical protein